MSKPKSFRLISGAIIIAFLFLLLPAPATLVLAQGTEETASKFLAGNTTAYLYFKPKDTNFQVFKNIFLRNLIPSLARIFILQKIKDKWGIDYNTEVEPWLAEITAATLSTNNSRGLIFLVGTNDLSTTRTTLGKWVGQDLSGYTYGNTIVKLRTLEGVTKTEYYAITDGTNKYLIAAIGNVAQADFETIVTRVKTDQAAPSPLSENAQFQDVRNNLPTTRISLSYLNEAGLPETAAALRTALDPYWLYIRSAYGLVRQSLQIIYQLPTFDTLYDTLDPIASPCYDASRQYSPPYMGVSFSAPTGSRLEFNFYSPEDNLPFAPAQINPLEIDNLVPADAFLFLTDLDFNAWWQRNYPTLKNKADQINDGFNRLENMGFLDDVQRVLGIDPRFLINFVKHANINENTFNWTTGEFAWARLLGSSRKEQLAIFEVANETELNNKLPGIIAALNAVGISGAESRRQGNFLFLGYPSGVANDALSRATTFPLQTYPAYQEVLTSYLTGNKRGLVYYNADLAESYILPPAGLVRILIRVLIEPLTNGGAMYFVDATTATGKGVVRTYEMLGGGGGGGMPPTRGTGTLYLTGLIDPVTGVVTQDLTLFSTDFRVTLNIPAGTKIQGKDGRPITALTVNIMTTYPAPPPGGNVIGLAYDFGPAVTFSPPIDMVFTYRDEDLPPGAVENELEIYFWNGTAWEALPTIVDPIANEVTTKVSTFTLFAVMWIAPSLPSPPAKFSLANLSILPATAKPGEKVTISAIVTNVGDNKGTYEVKLKINDVVEATRGVTLAPKQSITVTFAVAKETPGTYQVKVDGLGGSFIVEKVAVPPPTPRISQYWWTIVVGVVLIGLLVYSLWWQRQATRKYLVEPIKILYQKVRSGKRQAPKQS